MHSSFEYVFLLWSTMIFWVWADNLVSDYFMYKSVSRVTLFSCEKNEDDFRFVKRMNGLGMSVSVLHPRSESYNVSNHVARKDNWRSGLLLDTRCQTRDMNEKIMLEASLSNLYEGIHAWLILAFDYEEITQLLNDSSYSPLTDLIIALESNTGYELYDVYNPSKADGGFLNVTKLGFWDPENGLRVILTQDKFSRRSNLHGMRIKVGVVVKYQRPGMTIEEHLHDYTRKSEDPVSKYGFAVIEDLAGLFNFTMEVFAVSEWAATVNGTEKGLMVELSKANVEVGASPCSANSRFAAYGRVSMPGYPYRTFFLLRSSIAKFKWTELFTPLAIDSWLGTGSAAILAVVIIAMIQMTEYDEGWSSEFGHAIFATVGVICQQGLVFVPNRLAGRVAFLFLLFFGVLLLNYYGASVVSARLSEPPDKMNDSLYSLAKSHMEVASEPFFVVDDNLNSRSLVEWEVRYFNEKVWKKLSQTRYQNVEDGLKKVAQGEYAYHTSAEVAYPYIDSHWDDKAICDMTEVHVITPRVLSFYERADSPFTEMIRVGLIKTANVGLQRRTTKRWKPKTPYCSPTARSLQSITFFEIAPAVILMIIGTVLAFFMLQVEIIIKRMQPTEKVEPKAPKIERTGGKKTLLRA